MITAVIPLNAMDESTRLKFHEYYQAVCRERGWIDENGSEHFPADPDDRMDVIRDMFGLATIFGTDSTFQSLREKLGAHELSASSHADAIELLSAAPDDMKSAILAVIDQVLDSTLYSFLIQIDRFDHGHLSLHFQQRDEETCEPMIETDIDITTDSIFEMFQDALKWKEEFGMNSKIGRPDPNDQ